MAQKKEVTKKTVEAPKKTEVVKEEPVKAKGRPLGVTSERMIEVVFLKDFEGHKKGDKMTVPERKCRDSNRNIKRGYYKPV